MNDISKNNGFQKTQEINDKLMEVVEKYTSRPISHLLAEGGDDDAHPMNLAIEAIRAAASQYSDVVIDQMEQEGQLSGDDLFLIKIAATTKVLLTAFETETTLYLKLLRQLNLDAASEIGTALKGETPSKNMELPPDTTLPFFAYGIFRPGQLAFHQVKDFVKERKPQSSIRGSLRIRDGLPIIDPSGDRKVPGVALIFEPHTQAEAYRRIVSLEPEKHYEWGTALSGGVQVNVLFGKSPEKGGTDCEGQWNGRNDPLFTSALDVVETTLHANSEFKENLQPLFGLQMAYLLLWSSIERYVSLKYHLGDKVMPKVKLLAKEPAFVEKLREVVTDNRKVYRADAPKEKLELSPDNPAKSLLYYYQIRSNITHRGKAVVRDHSTLKESLSELLTIFRYVLDKGFEESR